LDEIRRIDSHLDQFDSWLEVSASPRRHDSPRPDSGEDRMVALLAALSACVISLGAPRSSLFPCATVAECARETNLWHVPGPNPIVAPADAANGSQTWKSTECEVAGGVFQGDAGKFYFIYHCTGTSGYQVGVSTAASPLGPWTPPPAEPNLAHEAGKWDESVVASFNIVPDPNKKGHWIGFCRQPCTCCTWSC
jgi:hypothetical protein